MSAEIICPYCDWPLAVEPDTAGRAVPCWNCQGEFVLLSTEIPGEPPDEPPVTPTAPTLPPPAARPTRVPAWVVTAAIAAVGVSGGVAWVSTERAADAERVAAQSRADRATAAEVARVKEDEAAAALQDAEIAWRFAEALAAPPAGDVSRAEPPRPDAAPAIPGDIPADVRDAATATLRKVGAVTAPLFRKALADNREELARLKNPFRPAPFPSPAARAAAVAACEKRVAAAETAVRAWEGEDLGFFAPDLTDPGTRGAVGRIVGRRVRVLAVPDRTTALVAFPTAAPGGRGREAEAVLTGVDPGRLAAGQVSDFADVVVVAGTIELERGTYPRLAVFPAGKP